ncbi:hypothetical protein [Verrucomicrobium sp. BvORR106]|uniref:hypothetical protein n=1 Tax=Verrucomicrobium sp. BvORR106 TaxID=1403819 RepID=UPI000570ABC9|nr:hypothetical protein [Verrucomicrobium sp. BvORR106]
MKSLSFSKTVVYNFLVPDTATEEHAHHFLSRLTPRELADASVNLEESLILSPVTDAASFGHVWVEFNATQASRWGWIVKDGDEWLTGPDERWLPITNIPVSDPLPGIEIPRTFPPWLKYRRQLPAERVPADASVIYWAPMPAIREVGE